MDITFEDSDIVEKNESMLIHIFYHLIDYDFRQGFFSDETSLYDMGTCGLTDKDYFEIADDYNEHCPKDYSYSQGMKFYNKLCNEKFDKNIANNFLETYGFPFDEKKHILKDLIPLFHEKFPNRDWDTDIIFIIKTLDNILEKQKTTIIKEPQDTKVVKLPVKKKLSPEEIKNSSNEYLLVKELGMTWDEARKLASENFDKKHQGKKFEPYLPEKTLPKPKI